MTEEKKDPLEGTLAEGLPVLARVGECLIVLHANGPGVLNLEDQTLSVFWMIASEDSDIPKAIREKLLEEYANLTFPMVVQALAANEQPDVKGVDLAKVFESLMTVYGLLTSFSDDVDDVNKRAATFVEGLLSEAERDEGIRLANAYVEGLAASEEE